MTSTPTPTPIPVPTVGRVVHYVSLGTPPAADGSQQYPSKCRAAIITDVLDTTAEDGGTCVSLCVLNPTGQFFNTHICEDNGGTDEDGHIGGTWHWPCVRT